jgi:hypothetical protein
LKRKGERIYQSGMAEMSSWNDWENERFERALATYGSDWQRVAAAVGGGKTVDDVRRHYALLEEDVGDIESGRYGSAGSGNRNNRCADMRCSLCLV